MAIPLSNTPNLAQIILEENTNISQNPDIVYQRAEAKLITLASKPNVDYIMDKLLDKELFYLVNSFDGITKKLREQYSSKGLDKDIFIRLIKTESKKNSTELLTENIGLSNRGLLRKQQKEEANDDLRTKAENDKKIAEDAREAFNDLVKNNENKKEVREVISNMIDKLESKDNANNKEVREVINDMVNFLSNKLGGVEEEQSNDTEDNFADRVDKKPFKKESVSQVTPEYQVYFYEMLEKLKESINIASMEEVNSTIKDYQRDHPTKLRVASLEKDPKKKLFMVLERVFWMIYLTLKQIIWVIFMIPTRKNLLLL